MMDSYGNLENTKTFTFSVLGYYGERVFTIGPYHPEEFTCCWDSLAYTQMAFRLENTGETPVTITQILLWCQMKSFNIHKSWNYTGPFSVEPPSTSLLPGDTYDFLAKSRFLPSIVSVDLTLTSTESILLRTRLASPLQLSA